MSKSSEMNKAIKLEILNGIDAESAGYGESTETTAQKIDFLQRTFTAEFGWRVKQVGRHAAMIEYLQGLPSSVHIPFTDCGILELAVKTGGLTANATEKQEDKLIDNYWTFMAAKICQLFDGYRVPKA